MSGHSKWSTIKRAKGAADAKRGQLFTKLAKELIVAVRQGGSSDPEMNFQLRMAIQRAKDSNMPSDSIDRAIKKGSGESSGQEQVAEVFYEGYGPGGTAILLQTFTDNKNRTVSDVRSTFTKCGGNLSEAGAVAWQFDQKGVVVVDSDSDNAEDLALVAIDSGADDFETIEDTIHIYSSPEMLEQIRQSLQDFGASVRSLELSMLPKNTITLDIKTAKQTLRLLDTLEDLDDVQKVFSNADFPDDVFDQYSNPE